MDQSPKVSISELWFLIKFANRILLDCAYLMLQYYKTTSILTICEKLAKIKNRIVS